MWICRCDCGSRCASQLLCTGQTPNTSLLRSAFPASVHADGPNKGMALVRRTLQLAEPVPADGLSGELEQLSVTDNAAAVPAITRITTASRSASSNEPQPESQHESEPESPVAETDEDDDEEPDAQAPAIEEDPTTRVAAAAAHVFAVGDAADAFGAVNAGHNAFFQGEVAARNVVRLVKAAERAERRPASSESHGEAEAEAEEEEAEDLTLEKYNPGPPAIKVSLGLVSVPRVLRVVS